jgi:hypothetical protein
MGWRAFVLAAIGIGLVAAAAWAQPDQGVLAPTVFATHNLPSDAITGFTVSCAPGYVAVSGGVSRPALGATLLSVRPVGLRALTFRFGNPVENDATRATVAVACRRLSGGPLLKLRPVKAHVVVRPGAQVSGLLGCPPNSTPVGAAVDLDPGRAKSVDSFAGASLSLRATTATPRAFQFRLANAARRAHGAIVQGNCATLALAQGVGSARLSTKITTYTVVVTPGRHHFRHRCRRDWIALGTGYELKSGSLRLDGTAAIGAAGDAWVRNTAASPITARLQLVCARVD